MRLDELLEQFCSEKRGCNYYKDYSGRFMMGRKCPAIVVRKDCNYVEVIMELARFVEHKKFVNKNALKAPCMDSLGLDFVIYFPYASHV